MDRKQTLRRVGEFVVRHKYAVGGSSILAITLIILLLTINRVRRKVLRFARKWLGIVEIQTNQGWKDATDFTNKMKAVGWSKSYQYCAYFVKMVILNCCKKGSDGYNFWNSHLSGSTQFDWQQLKTSSEYHEVLKKPEKGCIVIYQDTTNPQYGHIEFVEKVFSDGSYQIISGNTSFEDKSGRQGIVRKKRSKDGYSGVKILGFIKIKKL